MSYFLVVIGIALFIPALMVLATLRQERIQREANNAPDT